jgi:hypothetical protein
LGPHRRLAKDFENLPETLATFVTLASIQLALRRLPGRRPKVGKSEVKGPSPSRGFVLRRLSDAGPYTGSIARGGPASEILPESGYSPNHRLEVPFI